MLLTRQSRARRRHKELCWGIKELAASFTEESPKRQQQHWGLWGLLRMPPGCKDTGLSAMTCTAVNGELSAA